MWSESDSLKLIVYGDDPSTPEKEGFEFGEWLAWKVYLTDAQEEHNINVEYNPMMPDYDGIFRMLGLSALNSMQLATTGISTLNENNIRVFPNPANHYFSITGLEGNEQITIVNTLGNMIYRSKAEKDGQVNIQLNETEGLYYILIENNGKTVSKKLIIN
jgi:hypothetical protein